MINCIFWDIGGLLLSDSWDSGSWRAAALKFGLVYEDFERRHYEVADQFALGRLSLDDYLKHAVFHESRGFGEAAFVEFMLGCSQLRADTLALAVKLRNCGRYLLAALNNEARELNAHRIGTFGLDKIFSIFVSSCFVGLRKPNPKMFELALDLVQRRPDQWLLIDDREANVIAARRCGMHTIRYVCAAQLERDLMELGIDLGTPS